MGSTIIGLISVSCIFGGALMGLFLRRRLPDHHLSNDSKDTVKLGAGLIATLSALVLGLLISSAKSSFDTIGSEITQSAAKIILLDRALANYAPQPGKCANNCAAAPPPASRPSGRNTKRRCRD